jgi:hemerythrin
MRLTWDTSHAVFVSEIDDEHQEIFAALSAVETALQQAPADAMLVVQRLVGCIEDHFAHEERLMRAACYDSYRWHKGLHDVACRRVQSLVSELGIGETTAGHELVAYLAGWLHDHTRLADTMLGAFLRNRRRIGKITLRAGTKPANACAWVDANGNRVDPSADHSGY